MDIEAILFDVNGTMVDILTDESSVDVFRKMRNFLYYQGIVIHKTQLRDLYFQLLKQQQYTSREKYAEFNSVNIWQRIIELHETAATKALAEDVRRALPMLASQFYRSLTLCKKLCLYPGVENTLAILHVDYRLAIVTDAQSSYAAPELRAVGIADYFNPIVISGDHGYRKPDRRLFLSASETLNVKPENTVFVGNDMYRDVYGAKQAGMNMVYFASNQGDKEPHGAEPDYIIYEFPQLLQAIEFFKRKNTKKEGR